MSKNWFNLSAGVILLITGAAKVISAFGHAEILQRTDPILPLRFNHLMLAAGALELLVAAVCFFDKWRVPANFLTAWLATSFLIYRIGLWWIGWHRPCHCLGDFADAIGISSQTADAIMKGVLAYLLIGSYASLFRLSRRRIGMPGAAAESA